jgi:branched-chain amino acid transport system substrate-binding protein
VGLTHAGPAIAADEPDRYYPTGARTFAHLAATDDYQSAGIDLFLKRLGRMRLYTLGDGEGTGYAGADYAEQAAGKLGPTVVGRATWNPTHTRSSPPHRSVQGLVLADIVNPSIAVLP